MATHSTWTVIFEDKTIVNQTFKNEDGHSLPYKLDDSSYDSFWNDPKWSTIWAIQYKDDDLDYNDTVEFRDNSSHKSWIEADLGDFKTQFVSKWDSIHLSNLQFGWDNNNKIDADGNSTETEAEKITRAGARPTSYSSL